MSMSHFEIQYVSRRTGLNPHRIRAWERRYRAVMPLRTATHRRRYTETDIQRLQLLRQAVESGHRISGIARMSLEDLRTLVSRNGMGQSPASLPVSIKKAAGERDFIASGFRAIEALDAPALQSLLTQALMHFPRRRLIEAIIMPLNAKVGRAWVDGQLRIAHEHMASAVMRSFLGELLGNLAPVTGAAGIVVGTLSGQRHEMGAMTAALAAADAGWWPLYLGADLPAEEIAAAVQTTGAHAAAISIISTSGSEKTVSEVFKLGQLLRGRAAVFAGGHASTSFCAALRERTICWCDNLEAFHTALLDEAMRDRGVKI
jgi:DNA-binding transcriptional MerR regulator/methylmalonyl-CoA mutase cobalamin-binding subunit